ncbi:MAG: hypothetical protein ACREPB_14180 [Arenimonas sp.]
MPIFNARKQRTGMYDGVIPGCMVCGDYVHIGGLSKNIGLDRVDHRARHHIFATRLRALLNMFIEKLAN